MCVGMYGVRGCMGMWVCMGVGVWVCVGVYGVQGCMGVWVCVWVWGCRCVWVCMGMGMWGECGGVDVGVRVCVWVWECGGVWEEYLRRPEEGVRSPETRVTQ